MKGRKPFTYKISSYTVQHHDEHNLGEANDDHHFPKGITLADEQISVEGLPMKVRAGQVIVDFKDESVLPRLLKDFNAKVFEQFGTYPATEYEGNKLEGGFREIPATGAPSKEPVYVLSIPPAANFDSTEMERLAVEQGIGGHVEFGSKSSAHLFYTMLKIKSAYGSYVNETGFNTVLQPDTIEYQGKQAPSFNDFWWTSPLQNGLHGANIIGGPGHATWNYGQAGKGVKVAVVDIGFKAPATYAGVRTQEKFIDGKLWISPDVVQGYEQTFNIGEPKRNEDITELDPKQELYHDWHGRKVASIIFAPNNDHAGTLGVAPGATPVLIDIGRYDDVAMGRGVDQAVKMGAKVINLSMGGRNLINPTDVGGWIVRFFIGGEKAIKRAHQQGVILIGSGGNEGNAFASYPASLPEVMSVGAIDKAGRSAQTDSGMVATSRDVDLWAPGIEIEIPKSARTSEVYKAPGSSLSAPMVAGVAAICYKLGFVSNTENTIAYLRQNSYNYPAGPALNALKSVSRTVDYTPSAPPDGKLASPSPSPSTNIGDGAVPDPTMSSVPVNGDLFCQQNPTSCYGGGFTP